LAAQLPGQPIEYVRPSPVLGTATLKNGSSPLEERPPKGAHAEDGRMGGGAADTHDTKPSCCVVPVS
jgi:hypothetical protein